ncbi:DUF3293 domain-containing protein [Comamonas terrigena]|uniref:DUF3293 domain-containing protein n=1 Tax=Comamonas terrigena TaxID=32013 RepID=UPI0028A80965|nr:DUF3293 domain-containing protein [Comamonas terrigena]
MPLRPASTAQSAPLCADGHPTLLPAALVQAYRQAWYDVALPARATASRLQVDVHSPALQQAMRQCGARQACLLTACNPLGAALSPTDNERRMQALRAALQQDGWSWAPALGHDPQGQWPGEDSLLVWHMAPTQSRAWGRHWEQNAVLTVGSDAIPRLLLLR